MLNNDITNLLRELVDTQCPQFIEIQDKTHTSPFMLNVKHIDEVLRLEGGYAGVVVDGETYQLTKPTYADMRLILGVP